MSIPTSQGLSSREAALRLEKYGPNSLIEATPISPLRILLRQFTGVLVLVLIAAMAIAAFLGEYVDVLAIGLVVLLNGVLGFVQEWRAETALAALRKMLDVKARVVRDGRQRMLDAAQIVPGDLVVLEAGDRVPADIAVQTGLQLRVDESVLTGESAPVDKDGDGDGNGRLFMGTSVVHGRAEGVVTATGSATEFGQIAELTGSVGEKTTHLSRQLARLARQMGIASLGLGALVVLAGTVVGQDPIDMVMTGLSLAVAIVPEGLPAVVTITLALGAAAMVRHNALARRLQAVETLGAASVICTDKTGTLTENKMTAAQIWRADGRVLTVSGTGYDPAGRIEGPEGPLRHGDDPTLSDLLECAITCTHTELLREGDAWQMVGDPTEGALMVLAYKGWTPLPEDAPPLHEVPFTSERKRMSVVVAGKDGMRMFSKGAPEAILDICDRVAAPDGAQDLDAAMRDRVEAAYGGMAAEGLRVMALAVGPAATADAPEAELTFLGLVGMIDPPRPEVRGAVAACRAAGIRVILITGDSPVTAQAIAKAIGLPVATVATGRDVDRADDPSLRALLRQDVIFARTAPAHKMRLVEALQAEGQIVAMTGDGVNDAPALKRADIGVAMGIRGTDVAKDAADLVLLDDNFATIVRVVKEGRRQFENVQRFVRYLLSSNAGEVVAILANLLIGGPLILLATQILWMNLITDGVTAVALGLEKATRDQMERPPRPLAQGILGRAGFLTILAFGAYSGAAALWLFYTLLPQGEALARTAAFTAIVVFEKASVFAFRSFRKPCWRIGLLSNPMLLLALFAMLGAQVAAVYWPPLQVLLRTVPLGGNHWQLIGLLALPLIAVPEAVKTLRRR
ncbi:cation-translocating P-type ATPase [Nioella nitratireducens]|uniref:cation-translocating P-type ATPase n=1 Tax=Nioella nitratireducens TaxID=1287720 RepID=UPI0008FCEC20|nr:cation-transporting P-type ATPase [Nioella nitratireducens]